MPMPMTESFGTEGLLECDSQDRGTMTACSGDEPINQTHNMSFLRMRRDPEGRDWMSPKMIRTQTMLALDSVLASLERLHVLGLVEQRKTRRTEMWGAVDVSEE